MASIGQGIAAFLTGMASGAGKAHLAQTLQSRQLATKQKLDDISTAIESGDVARVEALVKDADVISIYDSDTRKTLLESARMNSAQAKLQRAASNIPALIQAITEGLGKQQAARGAQPPPEAPSPQAQAFGGLIAPGGPTEETLPPTGPRPLGFPTPAPTPSTTLAPTPTPIPAPTKRPVPPAPSPVELKGVTVSKEGDISFSLGLKGMNEQVLGRVDQLMNTMTAEQAIRQARSEDLSIDPTQEEALMRVDFAKVMNKFYTDNREEFERRNVDLRTRYILAFKHASNILGPAFAAPELRAFITEKPKIRDETEETVMAERAKTGIPLDAPITAKEIADAREQLRRERRGEKIFEAGPITQLKKETELGVPERLGPTERKEISERLAMFDTLSAIRLTFNSAFVGFLAGRARGAVTKVFGSTVKEAVFRTEAANIKNSTIRAITGAQVGGPQEADRIMQQIPDLNDPPTTFAGKFNSTWRNHISLQVRRAQIEESSGTFVPELVWRKVDSEIAAYEKAFGGKFVLDQGIMSSPLPTGEPPPYLRSKGIGQPLR